MCTTHVLLEWCAQWSTREAVHDTIVKCVCFCEQADPVEVLNDENTVVFTSNRLQEGGVPQLEQGMVVGQLTLADALIIGNCNNQVCEHRF